MRSDRLRYEPLGPARLDEFHRLVRDEHIRRYLLDGQVLPREWSEERVRESQALCERHGIGLWLARERHSRELVGFCGFIELPSNELGPELVYALFERFTGQSYATEMARAAITHARAQAGMREFVATVDEINAASLHILEKLGFERISTQSGSFGNLLVLRLADTQR